MIIESLNKVAKIGGLEFGCAIDKDVVDPTKAGLVRFHCGIVTPNNDMKIGVIRPDATTVNYAPADAQVDWANRNGLKVRGHNLVWNASVPAWIAALTDLQRQDLMLKHIDETMGHFHTVAEWDVVNEPIEAANNLPNSLRGGPWYDAWDGEAYIVQAFRRARTVAPSARLMLNEQGLEQPGYVSPRARQSFVDLIDRMLDAGLTFGVGIEGHIESQAGVSVEGMQWLVHELEDRKLDFRITEMDNWDYWFFNNTSLTLDEHDRKVSDQVRDLLFSVVTSPHCLGVSTWGLIDTDSQWMQQSTLSRPLAFDAQLTPKMMALAVRDAFLIRNAFANPHEAVKAWRLAEALEDE